MLTIHHGLTLIFGLIKNILVVTAVSVEIMIIDDGRCSVVAYEGFEEAVASIFHSVKESGIPPKCCYLFVSLVGVTSENTVTLKSIRFCFYSLHASLHPRSNI